MSVNIDVPKKKIEEFCHRNHILRLAWFGSVLRNDFTADSDIDVLVEFEADTRIGFFELYDMEQELSMLFGGRKIDINTPKSLSKYFRDEVLQEAENQYVKMGHCKK